MRIIALAAVLFCAACSSAPDPRLFAPEGEGFVLRQGSVVMKTRVARGRQSPEELRAIRVEDGVVKTRFTNLKGEVFEGRAPTPAWVTLWKALYETKPFSEAPLLDIEDDAPGGGGPYHLVTLSQGLRVFQFSGQYRANALGLFQTRGVGRRMDLVNQIVDLVATSELKLVEQPAEPPESDRK